MYYYLIMSTLAIISKWDPTWYGYGNSEDPKYINILLKLLFIWEIGCYPFQKNTFNAFKYLNGTDKVELYEETRKKGIYLKIQLIRGFYTYRTRMFAIPNKSFNKFMIKLKKRYKNKIDKKKNVKNLLNRQLYGKFIHK